MHEGAAEEINNRNYLKEGRKRSLLKEKIVEPMSTQHI
jgi:hypothetical protein